MTYGEEFLMLGLHWARIHFIENQGMAFGLELGGNWGKLLLSLFRIFAIALLIGLLRNLIKTKTAPLGGLIAFGLILAGAIGNMLDSAFYGMIFSASPFDGHTIATLFPEGGGYAGFLHGKVVDMFYFPMIQSYWPEWVPIVGGNRFEFFRPVFNFADSAICVGVGMMIVYYKTLFPAAKKN